MTASFRPKVERERERERVRERERESARWRKREREREREKIMLQTIFASYVLCNIFTSFTFVTKYTGCCERNTTKTDMSGNLMINNHHRMQQQHWWQ